MGFIFNQIVAADIITSSSKFYGLMNTVWYEHLIIGGLAIWSRIYGYRPGNWVTNKQRKMDLRFLNWFYIHHDSRI